MYLECIRIGRGRIERVCIDRGCIGREGAPAVPLAAIEVLLLCAVVFLYTEGVSGEGRGGRY